MSPQWEASVTLEGIDVDDATSWEDAAEKGHQALLHLQEPIVTVKLAGESQQMERVDGVWRRYEG